MKKIIILFVFLFLSVTRSYSQVYVTWVIDAKLVAALTANLGVTMSFLTPMANATEEIKEYQQTIMEKAIVIRGIEELMYNNLFEVSAIIKDGKNVVSASQLVDEIGQYQEVILEHAGDSPDLTLMAVKTQSALLIRTADLMTYIYESALVGGDENLLNSKQRMELIRNVIKELRIIRGIAYEVSMRMKVASRAEEINSVNIFDLDYPDADKEILEKTINDF